MVVGVDYHGDRLACGGRHFEISQERADMNTAAENDREYAFTIESSAVKFGVGALAELGADAASLGMRRIAFLTDRHVAAIEPAALALESLADAGLDVVVYDRCHIEPTDQSFLAAAAFVRDGRFDGLVSFGGGSVIDTAKVANLCVTHPSDVVDYVLPPLGRGRPVPGPLMPHIACPTTSGTGAEITGNAAFQMVERGVKTAISSSFLRPTMAVVDPSVTATLPAGVIAATGFDVLTNAIESLVARPFTSRPRPAAPNLRPGYQGANLYSEIGSRETIRMIGRYLVRAVTDADDHDARHRMMFAATYSRLASGNGGVHIPHAMSYSVAGLNHTYVAAGYERVEPMVPHGMAVVLNAPAAFRFTAPTNPERHREAAVLLGADSGGDGDAGSVLADALIAMMKKTGIPNGIAELGYGDADIPALVEGAIAQQRLLVLAPCDVSEGDLVGLYVDAMRYW
jgi:hydroxyacid-oxoacid transhydrogenase